MKRLLPVLLALVLMVPLFLLPLATPASAAVMQVQHLTTNAATGTGCSVAHLSATISPNHPCQGERNETCYEVWFEYGTSPGVYPYSTPHQTICNGALTFSADISNLTLCATYYVRAVMMCVFDPEGPIGVGIDAVRLPAMLNEMAVPIYYGNEINFSTLLCCVTEVVNPPPSSSSSLPAISGTIRPFLPPMFEVQNATVGSSKVGPGEQVEVTATVTNKGGSNGSTKIVLYVNGQEADSKGLALSSGQSTPVSFKVGRNDPGTYSVYVNGVSAGSFTVDMFSSNDILIYCVVALFVIAIIGLLYYVMKRRTA